MIRIYDLSDVDRAANVAKIHMSRFGEKVLLNRAHEGMSLTLINETRNTVLPLANSMMGCMTPKEVRIRIEELAWK